MTEPKSSEQRRIGARGAAIAGGYLLYLALDRAHATISSALVGVGAILIVLGLVDITLLPPEERSPRNLAIFFGGGSVALAVGLALVLL